MKVWLKQHHNSLIDSYRYGDMMLDKANDRVIIICPDTDNVLVNCSKSFYDAEVLAGRIVGNKG